MQQLIQSLAHIPKGQVTTYKVLGEKFHLSPRHVGKILHNNDDPHTYPCYKVIKSDGTIASGYAMGGPAEQVKKLKEDGVPFIKDRVDLSKALCILENL